MRENLDKPRGQTERELICIGTAVSILEWKDEIAHVNLFSRLFCRNKGHLVSNTLYREKSSGKNGLNAKQVLGRHQLYQEESLRHTQISFFIITVGYFYLSWLWVLWRKFRHLDHVLDSPQSPHQLPENENSRDLRWIAFGKSKGLISSSSSNWQLSSCHLPLYHNESKC